MENEMVGVTGAAQLVSVGLALCVMIPVFLLFIPIGAVYSDEYTLRLWPGQTIHLRDLTGWYLGGTKASLQSPGTVLQGALTGPDFEAEPTKYSWSTPAPTALDGVVLVGFYADESTLISGELHYADPVSVAIRMRDGPRRARQGVEMLGNIDDAEACNGEYSTLYEESGTDIVLDGFGTLVEGATIVCIAPSIAGQVGTYDLNITVRQLSFDGEEAESCEAPCALDRAYPFYVVTTKDEKAPRQTVADSERAVLSLRPKVWRVWVVWFLPSVVGVAVKRGFVKYDRKIKEGKAKRNQERRYARKIKSDLASKKAKDAAQEMKKVEDLKKKNAAEEAEAFANLRKAEAELPRATAPASLDPYASEAVPESPYYPNWGDDQY